MKSVSRILSLLFVLSFLFGIGTQIAQAAHLTPAWAGGALAVGLFVSAQFLPSINYGPTISAGISREIWQNHIEGNLFPDNTFMTKSIDASQYVVGSVVHIPQAGGKPNVEENRVQLPASVTTRTDTELTYNISEFTTDPITIRHAETIELSYNKRESILAEHEATLRTKIANSVLVKWAPTTNIIRSSGIPKSDPTAATVTSAAYLPGTTGSRNNFTMWDFINAQTNFDERDIDADGRYALLSSRAYQQLVKDMTATQYRDFSMAMDPKTGIVGNLFGFNIMKRSSVLRYDNSGTPIVKPIGTANATTDNDAILCWQINGVERAMGAVEFFEDTRNPLFYGDVYSLLVRMGGRKRRANEENVLAIVQQ